MRYETPRRIISVLLTFILIISMIPTSILTVHAGHTCPDCGDWIDGSLYCPNCGKQILQKALMYQENTPQGGRNDET